MKKKATTGWKEIAIKAADQKKKINDYLSKGIKPKEINGIKFVNPRDLSI